MSSAILTLGLGTFGGTKYLPTLGFNTGAEAPVVEEVVKTGTGGIDPPSRGRHRNIIKPLGTLHLPKKAKPVTRLDERVEQSREDQAAIAARLAEQMGASNRRFEATPSAQPVATMTMAQVDAEIAMLLRKKLRTQEDELVLLMLMAAAAVN